MVAWLKTGRGNLTELLSALFAASSSSGDNDPSKVSPSCACKSLHTAHYAYMYRTLRCIELSTAEFDRARTNDPRARKNFCGQPYAVFSQVRLSRPGSSPFPENLRAFDTRMHLDTGRTECNGPLHAEFFLRSISPRKNSSSVSRFPSYYSPRSSCICYLFMQFVYLVQFLLDT